jgi:ureidoacrylate peracid hydrolase
LSLHLRIDSERHASDNPFFGKSFGFLEIVPEQLCFAIAEPEMVKENSANLTLIQRKGRLVELSERLDPAHTALIVIDVQNDFCHGDGVFGKLGFDMSWMDPAIEQTRRLLSEARKHRLLTVFVRGNEDGRYLSVPMAETYHRRGFVDGLACKDSWGADWYSDIRPSGASNEVNFIKYRFGAFEDTPLDLYLRSNGITTLITAGVITSGCVESTVRNAFWHGYAVVVPSDCVADASEERHRASLSKMAASFGDVVPAEQIIAIWRDGKHANMRHWEAEWKANQVLPSLREQVDPSHTALVLVDLQGNCGEADSSDASTAIERLLTAARRRHLMVVHVNTEESDLSISERMIARGKVKEVTGGCSLDRIAPGPDEDVLIKHRSGSFSDTALGLLLRSSLIRTVIIVGSDLNGSIESTVRQASDMDYYVALPSDCILDTVESQEGRASAFERLSRFASIATSNDIILSWS